MNKHNNDDRHYFLKLIIVLAVIYIVDEISSNMNSSMQPYVLIDMFKVPGGNVLAPEYARAVSTATILLALPVPAQVSTIINLLPISFSFLRVETTLPTIFPINISFTPILYKFWCLFSQQQALQGQGAKHTARKINHSFRMIYFPMP